MASEAPVHYLILVCTAEQNYSCAMRRAVIVREQSGHSGFPGFPLSPERALILLWEASWEAQLILLPGILAQGEDQALERAQAQNDHPSTLTDVHPRQPAVHVLADVCVGGTGPGFVQAGYTGQDIHQEQE